MLKNPYLRMPLPFNTLKASIVNSPYNFNKDRHTQQFKSGGGGGGGGKL